MSIYTFSVLFEVACPDGYASASPRCRDGRWDDVDCIPLPDSARICVANASDPRSCHGSSEYLVHRASSDRPTVRFIRVPAGWSAPAVLDVDEDGDPSPATHAILTVFETAGERMFQRFLLTKTVVHAYRGAQPLFHALFWRQITV